MTLAAALTRRSLLAALVGLVCAAALPAQEAENPLAEYRWTNRVILIFSDSADDPRYVHQLRELEEVADELTLRDAVIVSDTTPGPSRLDTTPLRKKFRPHGFNLLLIGKDGEVKRRTPQPVDGSQIVRQIDRLPLRQQEMGR
ncbi:MAG: DUF4174 domain-containing protein [Pseudomonadota bacterium]